MQSEHNDSNDIVIGAAAIGAVLGLKPSQAHYLLKHGKLPAGRLGVKYIASRKQLLASVLPTRGKTD